MPFSCRGQMSLYDRLKAYGGSQQGQGTNTLVKEGDTFKIGQDIDVKYVSLQGVCDRADLGRCLHTPCHTQDSICFFIEDKKTNQRGVFTG